ISIFYPARGPPSLPPFPTRRSSDLRARDVGGDQGVSHRLQDRFHARAQRGFRRRRPLELPGLPLKLVGHLVERVAERADLVPGRSEEHTSELQSLAYLVCRLLLEKK